MDDFLYMLPGSERAFDDPAAVYEAEIEWDEDATGRSWPIEKFVAEPASASLPSLDYMIEWVCELAAEEGPDDSAWHWDKAGARDDVRAAFRSALDLLASHVHYRMCGKLVGNHQLTFTESGEPLLDGSPCMFRPRRRPMVDIRRPFVTIRIEGDFDLPIEGEEDGIGGIWYDGAPEGWDADSVMRVIQKEGGYSPERLISNWDLDPRVEVDVHRPGQPTETRVVFR